MNTTQPTGTEAAVCADITKRQQLGISKYGTTVAENPLELREWLQHAYEEALDQAVYLKRAIEEMEADYEPRKWAIITTDLGHKMEPIIEATDDFILTSSGTFKKMQDQKCVEWRHIVWPCVKIVFIGTQQQAKEFKATI